jgi:uncharacterized protein (TIGR03085 family)
MAPRHSELSPAAAERAALCDLFDEVGETAPTIDEGWNATDLAAHLLVRETRPDALAGLIIPPLHGYTAKVEAAKRAATPFAELVSRLRSGPPFWSPLGLPVVRDKGNLHEFFIHHEDVRRAQPAWKVRELTPATTAGLWNVVRMMAPMLAKGLTGARVDLKTPAGGERSLGPVGAKQQVTITGEPGEILLYLSGRRPFAQVRLTGSQSGLARLAAAPLGM